MVHYRVHKTSPMGPILSQIIPFLNLKPNVRTILISFSSLRLDSSRCPISFWYSNHNLVRIPRLSHVCYLPCLSHPPWLDHLNNIRSSEWSSTLWHFSTVLFLLRASRHPHQHCVLFNTHPVFKFWMSYCASSLQFHWYLTSKYHKVHPTTVHEGPDGG